MHGGGDEPNRQYGPWISFNKNFGMLPRKMMARKKRRRTMMMRTQHPMQHPVK
jgi:hypothetical protein